MALYVRTLKAEERARLEEMLRSRRTMRRAAGRTSFFCRLST